VRCRQVVVLREKDSSILVTDAYFEAEAGTRTSITTCYSRFKAYTSDTRFRYFLFSIIILFVWKHARRWRPGWFRVVRIFSGLCSILALRFIILTIIFFVCTLVF